MNLKVNLKVLKVATILAPAGFVALIEILRHSVFEEQQPMLVGNIILFGVLLTSAFFFSRFIFGLIERTQHETHRRNQELAALNSVSLAVNESLALDVVLYRALDKVLEVTGAEAGEIFLMDHQTQDMVQQIHAGLFPEAFKEKTRFRVGEGFAGKVAQFREHILVEDLSEDPRLLRGLVRSSGFRSLGIVPLESKNSVIGAISITSLQPQRFTPEDMQLLTNMSNQIVVAIENARLHEKAQGVATLEERERIAREMHDGLAQVLSYVNTKSQAARQFISSGQEVQAETQLRELEEIAQGMYADVRESILDLRTTASPQKDIVSTLKEYVLRFGQLSGIRTSMEISNGELPSLPATTELQIIRIIQEALTNVRKHAEAGHAWIRISTDNGHVEIVIKDDGNGFNASNIGQMGWPKFGLESMRERAESIGGKLDITSTSGKGTEVHLIIPLMQRREK